MATNKKESSPRATSIEIPALVEIMGYCFFVGGYFVGPQFSMKKFQTFIQRNINEDLPPSRRFAFKRFGIGLCYLIGHLLGDKYLVPLGYIGKYKNKLEPI